MARSVSSMDKSYEDAVYSQVAEETNLALGKAILNAINERENWLGYRRLTKAQQTFALVARMIQAIRVAKMDPSENNLKELAEATLLFIATTEGDESADSFVRRLLGDG